jgi:hypothetical protein
MALHINKTKLLDKNDFYQTSSLFQAGLTVQTANPQKPVSTSCPITTKFALSSHGSRKLQHLLNRNLVQLGIGFGIASSKSPSGRKGLYALAFHIVVLSNSFNIISRPKETCKVIKASNFKQRAGPKMFYCCLHILISTISSATKGTVASVA